MPTTYLLSIGINRYASEDISTLEGCDIDVKGLQELFLQKGWVQEENCLLLLDEKAGRQQMIDAIRTHFGQLQSGDTALLHFSGHGTTEPMDAAFVHAGHESAHGRNEALVCHDAFLPGIHPLSDKELRWLVAESQQGKEGVTFVGLFDCCHSGSMLKESDRWIKMTAPQRRKRHLSDYLEGQFQDRLDQEGCIQLPAVDYISLTACSPQEYAWGSTVGSLFTTCMMEVLLRHDLPPSYAELHLQLRQLVHPRSGNSQLPQIEYAGHANPYRRFLQAKMTAIASMPNLVKRGEKWFATNGAIHGIDVRAHRDAQLPIYQREQLIGWGMIELVFVEETSILPTWKSTHPTDLNHLFIGLHFMPLSIALTASKNAVHDLATLQDFFAAAKDLHTQVVPQGAKYELQSIGHQLLIHRLENEERKLLIGLEETSSKALDWLRFHWQMIENWERAWTLRTPKQSSIKASSISFLFSYWNAHRPKKT
ncbi:MAG: caspase family protein, partial [Bacteroidota bacterium]